MKKEWEALLKSSMKLNKKYYIISVIAIIAAYFFFSVFTLSDANRESVVYELIVCFGILILTVIQFLHNWYKLGSPTLLDWFRLTAFYSIIFDYLGLVNKFNGVIDWGYQGGVYLKPEFIIDTLFVVFIALLVLSLTEKIIYAFSKKYTKEKKYSLRSFNVFLFFSAAIYGLQLYFLMSGKIGYGTGAEESTKDNSFLLQTVNNLSSIILIVLGFFRYYYNTLKVSQIKYYYIFLGIGMIIGIFSGMKELFIVPFVCFLIPFLKSGNTIPKKIMIVFGVLIMVLYPLNNNYRDVLNSKIKLEKSEALLLALNKTYNTDITHLFDSSSKSYSARFSLYPYLQYSIEKEKEWNYYKNMTRYIYLPFSFIPRSIIPSKPISNTGVKFNKLIAGIENNSQTATTFGWAYLEGGYGYVIISFFLLALAVTYLGSILFKEDLIHYVINTSLLITMLKTESDIYFILAGIIQNFIISYFVLYIFTKKVKGN